MQAAASLCATVPLPLKGTKSSLVPRRTPTTLLRKQPRLLTIAAMATAPETSSTVDYSSPTSVFPAEACETVGGDACDVEMYPEVKPAAQASAAMATAPETSSTVDYSSPTSVFPAEACETVGGDACDVEMYPEVKPAAQASAAAAQAALEEVDREYLDYNEPKTVFPGEACDDLGGEFCEPDYQEGVYREQQLLEASVLN